MSNLKYFKVCGFIKESEVFENDHVKKYSEKIKDKIYLKKFGKLTYEKLKKGNYWKGMTKEMARISLGDPNSDNKSVGSWGVHNQWVYDYINLYFENGKLQQKDDSRQEVINDGQINLNIFVEKNEKEQIKN